MYKLINANRRFLIALLLAALTFAAFWRVLDADFINYDDYEYVRDNAAIKQGLTPQSIMWALTTSHVGNWQPLTWMSYMVDYRLFGLNPFGYHLVNLILHVLNTVLLFFVLLRLMGNPVAHSSMWKSAFVAALFAVHPLHVESVAWVAERKDVLSTFFWIVTMWAYVRYVDRPSVRRYVPMAMLFALGLMAKTMLVTLPVILLLLDYWPLGRLSVQQPPAAGSQRSASGTNTQHPTPNTGGSTSKSKIVLEKVPLFALSIGSAAAIYLAQRGAGAVGSLNAMPLSIRISNAFVAYQDYLWQTVMPRGLAVFYPHLGSSLPQTQVLGAAVLLLAITVLLLNESRKRPYLAVGWLWYVVSLLPVCGIVQIGAAARADHFTYVPLIGVFIIVAWGVPDLLGVVSQRPRSVVLGVSGIAVILFLASRTWMQCGYWKDTESIFKHTLAVTRYNVVAHTNYGSVLLQRGNYEQAAAHFAAAAELRPDDPSAHSNLAMALTKLGRTQEAQEEYNKAMELAPGDPRVQQGMADADAAGGSTNAATHASLAMALKQQGKLDEAIREYRLAIEIKPDLAAVHNNLAVALYEKGEYAEAWKEVAECRKYNLEPPAGFLEALSAKMPEPQ